VFGLVGLVDTAGGKQVSMINGPVINLSTDRWRAKVA